MRIVARDGPHIEFAQNELRNNAPSFARRSIFGVGATLANGPPYAEIVLIAWSSENRNRMFGRSVACNV